MTQLQMALELEDLLDHARAAASKDEERHSVDISERRPGHHSQDTIRGWGGAALLDLEWASKYVYSKAMKEEYRREYAAEYLRLRAERVLQLPS